MRARARPGLGFCLVIVGAMVGVALLAGCSYSPSADVLKALAGDPNSLCWVVTTPWGGATFDRNHGCAGNAAGGPSIILVEPGSQPSHVQVVKP